MYDELYELGMQEALEEYESFIELNEGATGANVALGGGMLASVLGAGLVRKKINPYSKNSKQIIKSDKQEQFFARNKWQEYMEKTGKKISYEDFIKMIKQKQALSKLASTGILVGGISAASKLSNKIASS